MGTAPPVEPLPLAAVCLVRDLMFVGKITATAAAAGVAVRIVRDPAALAGVDAPRLIVDLNQADACAAAVAWRAWSGRPVTGFVAHVDTATIADARAAGVDRIMARSSFASQLPAILTGA